MSVWTIKDERKLQLASGLKPNNTDEVGYSFVNIEPDAIKGNDVYGRGNIRHQETYIRGWQRAFSYATPIAYRLTDADTFYVSDERYSVSTNRHIGAITSALIDAGYREQWSVRHFPDMRRGIQHKYCPFRVWEKCNPLPPTIKWRGNNGVWAIVELPSDSDRDFALTKHGRTVAYAGSGERFGPYVVATDNIPNYVIKSWNETV